MGILPLKKRVNRDKCSFATKQRMFGSSLSMRSFAIDEPGSSVRALFATLVSISKPSVQYILDPKPTVQYILDLEPRVQFILDLEQTVQYILDLEPIVQYILD